MDGLEYALKMQELKEEDRREAKKLAPQCEHYRPDSDMASVKIYNSNMSLFINGNGEDGIQDVLIAPSNISMNFPINFMFDLKEEAYLSDYDCGEEKIATLSVGRYFAFNAGGWVIIQKVK